MGVVILLIAGVLVVTMSGSLADPIVSLLIAGLILYFLYGFHRSRVGARQTSKGEGERPREP